VTREPTERRALGTAGEAHARRHLERQGYRLIAANWRCPAGELDLVMRDGAEVVAVEVKTRRGDAAGRAEESITAAQGRRLLATTEWFMSGQPDLADAIWRVDLVAITLGPDGAVRRLSHVVNAVTADGA
jgi:putative endonuclease